MIARGFLVGVVATLAFLWLGAYLFLQAGWMPANADVRPPRIEEWAARTSLHATLAREAPRIANPVPLDDANLVAGIKLYGQNCAVCHGASNGSPSTIAVGLYQHAPQLARHWVEDDPEGVTFWKVAHGIRFTGMPAYGSTLSDRQIWQVALFLKYMNALPAGPKRAWQAIKNPGQLAPSRLWERERDRG